MNVTDTKNQTFISVFTPSQTSPEDLEAIFVQRQELLQDAIERIKESALTGNKHHQLFVGPRGSGKTHLVTLLVHRLEQDKELAQKLKIAWLNEDETSTNMLDLLLRIYTALIKRYPEHYKAEDIETVYNKSPEQAQKVIEKLLIDSLRKNQEILLIILENLDGIFEAIGDKGQTQLRAFLQENPYFTLFATAQKLVGDFTSRKEPFFGFFQTTHLKPLTQPEATELLSQISIVQKKPNVAEFLKTKKGRSRIAALHHLSGGNHRMYIVLSQFITRDSIDALVPPFVKMVDELTPYYQERLRWLPPQQRKIIELLSSSKTTVSVKEIARRLFATPQTISSQLKDLRDKGYVNSHQSGRESLYEMSEPLMRLCLEVKENQSNKPLEVLVDFIRAWYDSEDLDRRLKDKSISELSKPYLLAAIEKNSFLGSLLNEKFKDELRTKKILTEKEIKDLIKEISSYTEVINLKDTPVGQVIWALGRRGITYGLLGETKKAIADFTAVINLKDSPTEEVILALYNCGVTYGFLGETKKEIASYTEVLKFKDASAEQVARALFNRGIAQGQHGEVQKEISDYTEVINLKNAPVEQVEWALINRGVSHYELDETEKAIADNTEVLKLKDASAEQVASALNNRGVIYYELGKTEQAIADYTKLINLKDVAFEQVSQANFNLCELYINQGQWNKATNALKQGLETSIAKTPAIEHSIEDILKEIFATTSGTMLRQQKVNEIIQLYVQYKSALPFLAKSLIELVGVLYKMEKIPSPENLDSWLTAWQEATKNITELSVAMRILKVGITFLKTGGKDETTLFELTETERNILRQALGLEKESNLNI